MFLLTMALEVRFAESITEGDLEYLSHLHDNRVRMEFPSRSELDDWLELVSDQSDHFTYYAVGEDGMTTDCRVQCRESKSE